MSLTFQDLQTDVKSRAILNESSSEFDIQVKNVVNTSLFRVSRDGQWKQLRRKATVDTVSEYTTGTGAVTVTNGSKSVTATGATLITDGVHIGRRVDLGGSSLPYVIKTITGETTFTVDRNYDGTTSSTQSYKIYGQEEYNVPLQGGRIAVVWHEDFGYPLPMTYVNDSDFYGSGQTLEQNGTPTVWRQWGFDSVINQPRQAGVVSVSSSDSDDTSKEITIYGQVGGYPDYETISTNGSDGTTSTAGSKSFQSVERVVKSSATEGRITVTADTANTTVSVIPANDIMGMSQFYKVQIFPFPDSVYPINFGYYKDPARLVQNTDMHELGSQFDEAIILLAVAKLNYGQSKKGAGDDALKLYLDEIKSLKKYNSETALSWFPRLRKPKNSFAGGGRAGHSQLSYAQLGGNYGPIWR